MTMLPDTLNNLAAQGVTLRLSARLYSPTQLNQLAAHAAGAKGRLIVTDADSLSPQQAKTLGELLGKGLELQL